MCVCEVMNLPISLHTPAGKMKLAVSALSHRNLDKWCEKWVYIVLLAAWSSYSRMKKVRWHVLGGGFDSFGENVSVREMYSGQCIVIDVLWCLESHRCLNAQPSQTKPNQVLEIFTKLKAPKLLSTLNNVLFLQTCFKWITPPFIRGG